MSLNVLVYSTRYFWKILNESLRFSTDLRKVLRYQI